MRLSPVQYYKYAYAVISLLSTGAYKDKPEAEALKAKVFENPDAYFQSLNDKSYSELTPMELSIRIRVQSL